MAGNPQKVDGRAERTARTREAITDALFQLVGGGILRPTAQQVADRADVAIRTVFRHFADMESLYAELDARLRADVHGGLQQSTPDGDLPTRVRGLVAERVLIFETIANYKRATDLQRWESEFLAEQHRRLVREQRASLLRWIPELNAGQDARKQSAELVTSFAAWNRLRVDQGLSVERAGAAVEHAMCALLDLSTRALANKR